MNSHASPLHALPRASRIGGMAQVAQSNLQSRPCFRASPLLVPTISGTEGERGRDCGLCWEEECGPEILA